ncbi:MAG: hypothetical protein JXM70_27460, partial [Pirellulales bacterium]|nr:hypothetical protein [Pirellulales bacterium]
MLRFQCLLLMLTYGVSVAQGDWASTTQPAEPLRVDTSCVISPSIIVDLGGTWETTSQTGHRATSAQSKVDFVIPSAEAKWTPVQIPGQHFDGTVCWYRRTVDIPDEWAGRRITLRFAKTQCETEIYWNGKLVHTQIDGSYSCDVDVTKFVKPGRMNTLMVGTSSRNVLPPKTASWFTARWRGIRLPVSLTISDPVSVVDVFAKPSVEARQLSLEVTVEYLKTPSARTRNVSLVGWVKDTGTIVKNFVPASLKIAPGEQKTVSLTVDWQDAKLWWPYRPYLYQAGVEIHEGGTSLGGKLVRFGFREFRTKGHLVYLNGKKLFLFRKSVFPHSKDLANSAVRQEIRKAKSRGYNAIRTHYAGLDYYNDIADEEGMLIFPETPIKSPQLHLETDPRRWELAVEHIKAMVRRQRNHPSVVMWNICNEVAQYRGKNVPRVHELLNELGDVAQRLDPTRLVSYDGDLDLKGLAPTLNYHYPWQIFKQARMLPTTIYWLDEGKTGWLGHVWKKDKPLIIGEYFNPPYSLKYPHGVSQFAGDRAYVDPDGWAEAGWQAYKWINEGYAHAEVFCINPWGVREEVYAKGPVVRRILLAMRQKNTTFFSGEKVSRTMYVYNYTLEDRNFTLNVRLGNDDNVIFQQEIPISLPGGESQEVNLDFTLPKVLTKREYAFTAKLLVNEKEATDGERATWSIFPKPSPADWPKAKIVVITSNPKHLQELRDVCLPFQDVRTVDQALSHRPDLILAYGYKITAAEGAKLRSYVSRGGRIVMVNTPNGSWLPGGAVISDREKRFSTHAFFAVNQHPLLEGLIAEDIQLWRPDTLVCRGTFRKPAGNSLRSILDAGGGSGIRWSPLLELWSGKGRYILCQMNLIDRLGVEPAAEFLLKNIVRAALRPVDMNILPICILGQDNRSLLSFIKDRKFALKEQAPGSLVIVDGSTPAGDLPSEQLASAAKQKGTILLHDLNPDTAQVISDLTGIPIVLTAQKSGQVVRTGRDPILDGLSNYDFFWMSGEFSAGHDGNP